MRSICFARNLRLLAAVASDWQVGAGRRRLVPVLRRLHAAVRCHAERRAGRLHSGRRHRLWLSDRIRWRPEDVLGLLLHVLWLRGPVARLVRRPWAMDVGVRPRRLHLRPARSHADLRVRPDGHPGRDPTPEQRRGFRMPYGPDAHVADGRRRNVPRCRLPDKRLSVQRRPHLHLPGDRPGHLPGRGDARRGVAVVLTPELVAEAEHRRALTRELATTASVGPKTTSSATRKSRRFGPAESPSGG